MAAFRRLAIIGNELWRISNKRWNSGLADRAAFVTGSVLPADGLTLSDFMSQARGGLGPGQLSSAKPSTSSSPGAPSVFIETYGCQMNVNDSEVVHSVLSQAGYVGASSSDDADVILLNTCAIRDHAESKIWQRLGYFKNMKAARRREAKAQAGTSSIRKKSPVVGVLGCMAERLKHRLLESDKMVDLVAGPDAYRDLPRLINIVQGGTGIEGRTRAQDAPATQQAINVQLSADETYADVVPVRPSGAHSVFLSIMRGCNNMCAFCVVPFTRGRERSRPASSIVDEVRRSRE